MKPSFALNDKSFGCETSTEVQSACEWLLLFVWGLPQISHRGNSICFVYPDIQPKSCCRSDSTLTLEFGCTTSSEATLDRRRRQLLCRLFTGFTLKTQAAGDKGTEMRIYHLFVSRYHLFSPCFAQWRKHLQQNDASFACSAVAEVKKFLVL